ncbi:two-component sensor histidine kinase [Kitasatospora sp. RG8]|uniref:sensor histidine kinase n=1 Tax=Kitasatospora sp. RG8 TaxID=2820815 RepID=UPI001AE0798D|nr:ATP-binding protein [Kitasatospora sp. RG8]MBP0451352.1 two-component sensor histidine kinase [Kitasatospora sp. RG8]
MSQILALAVPAVLLIGWAARGRYGVVTVTGAAGAVSVATTAGVWAAGRWVEADRWPGLVGLLELASLLLLVVLALRAEDGRRSAVAAWTVGGAVALWPSRFDVIVGGPLDALTLFGFGSAFTLPVVLAGLYLRGLDETRRRSVAAARRVQRLELAHDLHDFVAHDVSGMVAQAQAGIVLAASDPARAAALFERIEKAGLQALASLDRTVHLLRSEEPDGPERGPQPGLAELTELTDRFAESGGATVRLDTPAEQVGVPREVAATAYRIVVEALTNVRRHAPAARAVDVKVRREGRRLEVMVQDDGGGPQTSGPRLGEVRRGGSGLAGLAARVEALGGTLSSGREKTGGWRVTATMPLEGR